MKTKLLTTAFILLSISSAFAQSFISITPNNGVRGQTIATTVTGSGFFFTMGSPPSIWGDFYMKQGGYSIYPSSVNVINDNIVTADWPVPANAPIGNYDVIWEQWIWPNPLTHYVPGGFNIGDAFISGKVFYDNDSSGTMNGNDNPMFNKMVLLLPDSFYSFTNTSGDYMLATTSGNKNVKILPGPAWNTTTTNPVPLVIGSSNVTGVDFGLKGISDFIDIDASLTLSTMPRCWTQVPFWITYTNTGSMPTHGEVNFIRAVNCTYVGASIPPDNINSNVYTWNYTNLLPGESRTIQVILTLPGPGTVIQNSVQVIARDALNAIADVDEALMIQNVICAYDPNDKSVIPEGVFAQHYTLMTDTLDFVIRFQNTGNDTAFKVVILDTLNKNILDINSFEIIASSHNVVPELRTNGRVTFTFDNILLPDSNVNEPESHGFVRYRCRIKSGLPNNTVLNNRGHIYFDLNPAIVTNTTLNTLVYQIPVGIQEPGEQNLVSVMPNPVTDDATILFNNPDGESFNIKIYSLEGKLVYSEVTHKNIVVIDNENLRKGVYLIELKNEKQTENYKGKFVKL